MLAGINSLLKKIFNRGKEVRAFVVTRLLPEEIREKVFIRNGERDIDISERHSMICLDPFSMAIWLDPIELRALDTSCLRIAVKREHQLLAEIDLLQIGQTAEGNIILLLFRVSAVKNFQLNALYRFITLRWLLKNKTSTYRERKFIAALYAYPRRVITVSYKEEDYCNIFPMDIQRHVTGTNLYLFGLRNSNITLEKILKTKKMLVADTCGADIKTIYSLGRHFSAAPPKLDELPFGTIESTQFKFPVPLYASSFQEVEITSNVNMGYHMLLIGKIVNAEKLRPANRSLYHVHFFTFKGSGYKIIANEGYS